MARIEPTKSPNLPIAPSQYARQHFDVFNNVLRLYFTRIDGLFSNLFGTLGGKYIEAPHISALDTTDQYATADNTATMVKWNTLEASAGFTLNLSGSTTASQSGVYKIDYSLQFANTNNLQHDVFVWVKVNGVDVVGSASRFTLPARKSAGVYGYIIAYSSVTFTINAGDEFALYWATEKAYNPVKPVDGVFMEHLPSQSVPYARPSNPSAVGSIVFVSRNGT